MAARSTKGVTVCMVTGGATGTLLTITDIDFSSAPAVCTIADTSTIIDGDLVTLGDVGIPELNGNTYPAEVLTSTTFTLTGSDAVGSQGTFSGGADNATHFTSSDMTCCCFSEMTFSPEDAETLSVGTYCDPTAQITSAATAAGTLDFAGFIDIGAPDYRELLKAEADNNERIWRITMPENGYMVFPATVSQITQEVPLDGALGYTGQAALGSKPQHLFN